jgi:hypothetical protein
MRRLMRDQWNCSWTLAGTFDECGGTQTITWTFTDDCDRTITHVQTITIEPAPIAALLIHRQISRSPAMICKILYGHRLKLHEQ